MRLLNGARALATLVLTLGVSLAAAATLPLYRIKVSVEPEQRSLTIDSDVTLPAATVDRHSLRFMLRSDMATPVVDIVAPARIAGTVPVIAVGASGPNTVWEMQAPAPLPASEAVVLRIRHAGGGETSLNFHVGPEVVFAGGGSTAWYPQFDGMRGRGVLTVRVPAAMSVVATAVRTTDDVSQGWRTVTFQSAWPTHFSFTAGPYIVQRYEGPRPITLYLLKPRAFSSALAQTARRSLEVLGQEFGPYPFGDFSILEIPTSPAQQSGFLGAAYDGYMLMRSDYMDSKGADPHFFGHEIGHQWWGVSIEKSGAGGEYMMDEALANFGGLRVVEAMLGANAARRYRAGLGGYDGAQDAIALIEAGYDKPLDDLPSAPQYYALSDSKGYLFYDMLARLMKPARLRQALREIANERAHSTLAWATFIGALRHAAGRENSWFFDQWLEREGLPVVWRTWKQSGRTLTIDLHQRAPAYRMTLPVRIDYLNGTSSLLRVRFDGTALTRTLQTSRQVSDVVLDPDRTTLYASTEEAELAAALRFVTRGRLLWDNGKTDEAEAEFRAGLAAAPDRATPAEFTIRFYLGWIAEEAGKMDQAATLYEQALALPVRDTELLAQAYLHLARVATALGEKPKARSAAFSAIAADKLSGAPTRISDRARRLLE